MDAYFLSAYRKEEHCDLVDSTLVTYLRIYVLYLALLLCTLSLEIYKSLFLIYKIQLKTHVSALISRIIFLKQCITV